MFRGKHVLLLASQPGRFHVGRPRSGKGGAAKCNQVTAKLWIFPNVVVVLCGSTRSPLFFNLCVGVMLFKAWKICQGGLDGEIQLIPPTISCLNALAAARRRIKGGK